MEALRQIINEIYKRLDKLERDFGLKKISIPTDGYLVPKVLSSDPAQPTNNEVWINSSTNQLKWNKNGTIKTITFS